MKLLKNLTYLFLLTLVFVSCSDDDNDSVSNEPPNNFEIFFSVGANALEVNWTEAVDPENEEVTYEIYLNDVLKDDPFYRTSELSYLLLWQDVNTGTNTINVIAKDKRGAETASSTTYDNIPN